MRVGYLADVVWSRLHADRIVLLRPLVLMRAPVQGPVSNGTRSDRKPSSGSDAMQSWTTRWVNSEDDAFESLCRVTHYRPPPDQPTFGFAAVRSGTDHEAEVIGGLWISVHQFRENDGSMVFKLPNRFAWLHSARVHPDHRRMGVYRGMMHRMWNEMSDRSELRNVRQIGWTVHRLNQRSVAAHAEFARDTDPFFFWRIGPYGGLRADSDAISLPARSRMPIQVDAGRWARPPKDCQDRPKTQT